MATAFRTNPFAFIFPACALAAVALYFLYGAFDRIGLDVTSGVGTVTGKQYNPSGKGYYTTIIDGRSVVQSQERPETYALTLVVNGEPTSGLVSKQLYESINPNDNVQVRIRRTRITKRLEVVEVRQ
jgi:hypothetical protein